MSLHRRVFLKTTFAGATLGVAVSAGLLSPRTVLAAWPKSAFDAKSVEDAVKGLGGGASETSADIKIKAPDIAENGAVVPVTVETSLPADAIVVMASSNASPLAADFNLGDGASGFVSTRIKMGKTGDVVAVVKSGGKLYSARKSVKVTIGGCGG